MRNFTISTKRRILYVDDEPQSLKYFTKAFSKDFEVLTATRAKAGEAILNRKGLNIAVLVSDQRMPGGNGIELLRYALKNYPHISRVLTTAYTHMDYAISEHGAGEIMHYISKPWDVKELMKKINAAADASIQY